MSFWCDIKKEPQLQWVEGGEEYNPILPNWQENYKTRGSSKEWGIWASHQTTAWGLAPEKQVLRRICGFEQRAVNSGEPGGLQEADSHITVYKKSLLHEAYGRSEYFKEAKNKWVSLQKLNSFCTAKQKDHLLNGKVVPKRYTRQGCCCC